MSLDDDIAQRQDTTTTMHGHAKTIHKDDDMVRHTTTRNNARQRRSNVTR